MELNQKTEDRIVITDLMPNVVMVIKIAACFGVTVDQLVQDEIDLE